MKTLGRTASNDIYLKNSGLAVISSKDAQRVIIEALLLTQKGELQFDDEGGIDYFGTVLQSPTFIEPWAAEVRTKIEALPFVESVEDFEYRFDAKNSTLYWSMKVFNTDGEEIDFTDKKTQIYGTPGVDVKWDDVYDKPLNTEEATDMVRKMSEAALAATNGGTLSPNTLNDVKKFLNSVLLDPEDPNIRAKKNITFTFNGIAIGSVIDLESLYIDSATSWTAEFSDGEKFWFDKTDHKIVTKKSRTDGGLIINSYTHTFKKRGDATLTINGTFTGIRCEQTDAYPIFRTTKGSAFQSLVSVSIGSRVPISSIGEKSFSGFRSLTDITWQEYDGQPVTITDDGSTTVIDGKDISFGDYAFENCSRIYGLSWIPSGLTSIGKGCFRGCSGLTDLSGLTESITEIPDECFQGCESIVSLDAIRRTVTSIGESSFKGCTALASIDGLPPEITEIPDYAFYGCSSLKAILYPPEGLTEIGDSSFEGCSSLKSLYIPENVITIGTRAFAGCTALDNIFVDSDSVPQVSDDAFEDTDPDLTAYVPKPLLDEYISDDWGNVPYIKNFGVYTFNMNGPNSGFSVTLNSDAGTLSSDSIWTIDTGSESDWKLRFENTETSLPNKNVEFRGIIGTIEIRGYIKEFAGTSEELPFITESGTDNLREVVLLDTPIEKIGDYSFAGCVGLETVDLGDGWDGHPYRIGEKTFFGCSSLTSLSWIKSGIGLFENTEESTEDHKVYLPAFGEGCFHNSGVIQLDYPKDSSLTTSRIDSLPPYCFSGTKISSLSGIGGSEMKELGEHCFDGCDSLTDISDMLGTSIRFLPDYCFANCSSLPSIHGIENIISTKIEYRDDDGDGVFTEYRTIILGKHLFENCVSIAGIAELADSDSTYPDEGYSSGIEDLSDYMFAGCSVIRNLNGITSRIRTLGTHCFENCIGLNYEWDGDEVVPETYPLKPLSESKVVYLPDYCFSGCTSLPNLIGLDKITSVGNSCFEGCTGLVCNSGIGWVISSYGSRAFADCSALRYFSCLSTNPPSAYSDTFSGVGINGMSLYVRNECIPSYNTSSVWGSFGTVESRTLKLTVNGVESITEDMASSSVLRAYTLWKDNKYVPGCYYVEYGDNSSPYTFIGDVQVLISTHEYSEYGNYVISIYGDILEISAPEQSSHSGEGGVHYIPSDGDGTIPFFGELSSRISSIALESSYLERIGDFTFRNYSELSSLSVSMSPTGTVGGFAFANCGKLRYASNLNASSLGDCAFMNCQRLENVSTFSTVSSIGYFCFSGDVLLGSIEGLSSVETVGAYAFSGCTSLASTSGLFKAREIGHHAFSEYENDGEIVYGSCESLKTITGFGDSLVDIGDYAFYGCQIDIAFIAVNVPPLIYEHTFDSDTSGTKDLYVPLASIETYRTEYPVVQGSVWDGSRFNYWSLFGERIKARNISFRLTGISTGFTLAGGIGVVEADGAWSISYGEGEKTFTYNGTTTLPAYRFISGTNDEKIVTISGAITGIRASSITAYPFMSNERGGQFSNLKEIDSTLALPLKSFGSYTFKGCTGLESVGYMDSVTSIGTECFSGCNSITDISGLTSVISIGDYAFSGCSNLKNLKGLHSVETIGQYAFDGCTNLKKIDGLGMNVTSIGDYAFRYCPLKEVQVLAVVPPTVSDSAFSTLDLANIPLYVLSRSVSEYENWGGFSNISSRHIAIHLNNVVLGASILGEYGTVDSDTYWAVDFDYGDSSNPALVGFDEGESIKFPSHSFSLTGGDFTILIEGGVTKIQGTSVEDEDGVALDESCRPFITTESNGHLVNYITSATTTDTSSLETIGDCAFFRCNNLGYGANSTIPSEVNFPTAKYIGRHSFEGCTSLKELIGFSSAMKIGAYSFYGCTYMTKLSGLASTLTDIEANAFGGGIWIEYIQIAAHVAPVLSPDAFIGSYGGVEDKDITENPDIPESQKQEYLDSKKIILNTAGEYPYYENSVMVYVPASSIASYEGTVAWSYFGEPSSQGIRHYISSRSLFITLKDIPAGTTFNGNATGATNITANGSWTIDWGDGTKPDTMSQNITTIPPHTYSDFREDTTITIDGDIRAIMGEGTDSAISSFYPIIKTGDLSGINPYITSVKATEALAVTSIGKYTFAGCTALTSIEGFDNVEYIGWGAFYGCSALSFVSEFPNVTTIDGYAFSECSLLPSVACFPLVSEIGNFAFYNDAYITSISGMGRDVGSDVKAVFGSSAFAGCSLATLESEYVIPPTITSNTFAGTSYADTPVYVPVGTVEAYKSADVWKEYFTILETCYIEFSFSGIEKNDKIGSTEMSEFNPKSAWSVEWGDGTVQTFGDTVNYLPEHEYKIAPPLGKVRVKLRGDFISIKAGYPSGSLYPIIAVTRNNNLFYNNLNEVTFNSVDSLSSIGKGTFALCKELLRVRIVTDSNSLSLTSIGNHAFYNCEKLSTVVLDPNEEYITGDCKIPTTVTSIGNYCFANCTSLESVTIPSSVTSIGDGCFTCTTYLTDSKNTFSSIDSDITNAQEFVKLTNSDPVGISSFHWEGEDNESGYSIGLGCFLGCTSIGDDITLPSRLNLDAYTGGETPTYYKSLPDYIFFNCRNITNPKLFLDWQIGDNTQYDNGFWKIGAYAYAYTGISSVSNAVVRIGSCPMDQTPNVVPLTLGQFMGSPLTNLNGIPDYFTLIDGYCFANCTSLVTLDASAWLPNVTEYRPYSFSGCTGMQSIKMPAKQITFWNNAFSECGNIETIDFTLYTSGSDNDIMLINGSDPFSGITVKQMCRLNVPTEKQNSYQEDSYWKYFDINGYIDSNTFLVMNLEIPANTTRSYTFTGGIVAENSSEYVINWGEGESEKIPFGSTSSHTFTNSSTTQVRTVSVSVGLPKEDINAVVKSISGRVGASPRSGFGGNANIYDCDPILYSPNGPIPDTSSHMSSIRTLCKYNVDMKNIVLIRDIDLLNGVFSNCCNLNTVYGANHILNVGNCAFQNCNSLKFFRRDDPVSGHDDTWKPCHKMKTIGTAGFMLAGITTLAFIEDAPITYFGRIAFAGSTLTSIADIPNDPSTAPNPFGTNNDVFLYCELLESLEGLQKFTGLTRLPAMFVWSGIKSLKWLPPNLQSIGGFQRTQVGLDTNGNNGALSWLPSSVTEIQAYCFRNSSLSSIEGIPSGVTRIGNFAFASGGDRNNTFTSISGWPTSCTIIPTQCFSGTDVQSLNGMPNTVVKIEGYAFYNCKSLQSLNGMSPVVTTLGESCFRGTGLLNLNGISSIIGGAEAIGENCFQNCLSLTDISALSGLIRLTSLPTSCFYGCSSLKTIGTYVNSTPTGGLPKSLTTIGSGCFGGCPNITIIVLNRPAELRNTGSGYEIVGITEVDTSSTDAFDFTSIINNPDSQIYVPILQYQGTDYPSLGDYRAADGWNKFNTASHNIWNEFNVQVNQGN